MSWWVAGAALVGTIGGSLISSNGAQSAAGTQAGATQAAIDEQARQFNITQANQAPYRAAGVDALGQLQSGLSQTPTAAQVMSDPGYQFGLQQGQLGLDRKAAAAGGRVSGASLKAASQYATDYATTGYNAAYQRGQDRLNRLAALAGVGQTATQASAASGTNSANQISSLLSSQGNATAASQLAQGNIWGNTLNQLGAMGQRWATTSGNSPGYSPPTSPFDGYTGDYNSLAYRP